MSAKAALRRLTLRTILFSAVFLFTSFAVRAQISDAVNWLTVIDDNLVDAIRTSGDDSVATLLEGAQTGPDAARVANMQQKLSGDYDALANALAAGGLPGFSAAELAQVRSVTRSEFIDFYLKGFVSRYRRRGVAGLAVIGSPAARSALQTLATSGDAEIKAEAGAALVRLQPGKIGFALTATSVSEFTASVSIAVSRTDGSSGPVSVNFATANGTALGGTDFTATQGVLSWADGDAAPKTITVRILDDLVSEPTENFTVTLSGATGGAVLTGSTFTVTVADDDIAQTPGTVALAPTSFSVNESVGSVTIQVARTGGSRGAVSVTYGTANGTAAAFSDFTPLSGTITWPDGTTGAVNIVLPIVNDSLNEAAETFTFVLTNLTGGASLGSSTATITIADDDVARPVGTLELSSAAIATSESSGQVVLQVARNGGSAGVVSVAYSTAAGTATAGGDFTPVSGILSWADGDTAPKNITLPVLNDTVNEPTESFSVTLSNPTGGAAVGVSTSVVTVSDDDPSSSGTGGTGGTPAGSGGTGTTVTVTNPPATGGGGPLDAFSLVALAGLIVRSVLRQRGRTSGSPTLPDH